MPGPVERDSLTHFLGCQLGLCLILIESRVQFFPELIDFNLEQHSVRRCKPRHRQAIDLFVKRLTQFLSFQIIFRHFRHETSLLTRRSFFKSVMRFASGRDKRGPAARSMITNPLPMTSSSLIGSASFSFATLSTVVSSERRKLIASAQECHRCPGLSSQAGSAIVCSG